MTAQETRNRIKETAIALFNEHGTPRISTNTIAERCGISKGNLHYHYRNKHEIIRAIHADMIAEIESGWDGDDKHPTVIHMAEMFSRQLDLVWRYRYFYREMVALVLDDEELRGQVRAHREKRIDAVVKFFEALVQSGEMKKLRSKESLRYLVIMTWIFSDNWLNFMELHGDENAEEAVQLGYDLIVEMLYPYLTDKARREIYSSYQAINRGDARHRSAGQKGS